MYKLRTVKNIMVLLFVFTAVLFLFGLNSLAQTPPVLIFSPVVTSGLSSPLDIANARDGSKKLYIVQQGGKVRIVSSGVLLPGNFLDIPDSISTGGERGLLSIAFHPDFVNNRYLFVYYTNTAGDVRITRFQTQFGNPDVVDESTGTVIMTIPEPFANHNGGKLNFGADGNLYFGTGDGGSGGDPNNYAQNGNSLLGKLIRINVDNFTTPPYYTIPPGNPYIGVAGYREEIYAMGLRNPWRWSFDRLNNDVWIADVGQSAWEEINSNPIASVAGMNYGWRCYEGNAAYNTAGCQPQNFYTSPIFAYPHNSATGGFSVTGGYVYRGIDFPAMYGYYICSDYVSGNTWLIKSNGVGGWNVSQHNGLPGSIASFGEDEDGNIYALSLTGSLYKVTTNSVLPLTWRQFNGKIFTGYNELQWTTVNEQNLSHFEIEYSRNGTNYINAGRVSAINGAAENKYSFQHLITGFTRIFYRIKIIDKDGKSNYSNVITLDKEERNSIKIYPSPVTNDQLNIISTKAVDGLTLFTAEGKKVFQTTLTNVSGTINIPLPHFKSGMYFLQVKLNDGFVNKKIIIRQE